MLALMQVKERSDAAQVVNAPIDPAQALLKRFTAWEKRMDNLIEFFTQIQRFQKEHSKQYSALSDLAGQTFGDEMLPEEGVVSIWRGLRDKTSELARFYDGLVDGYNETIIKDLKTRLSDIRTFKSEIERLRSREAAKVSKRQKKFFNAVSALNVSINRIRAPSARDDPFVENRECLFRLGKWIDRDNKLKLHIAGIQQKCAEFEYQLVPKIKEAGKAYATISQNEFQIAGDAFVDINTICDRVPQGLDWQYFISTETSFRTGTMQLDPAKLTYSNSNHPCTSPAIAGDIYVWNKLLRRWDPGTFCVTRTGYLMQFDRSLTELKDNIKPIENYNLNASVLGDLATVRGEACFSLVAEKYTSENHAHGTKKLVKAPVRLVKYTMSKLTTEKFCVPMDQAQQWYDAIAAFAKKENEPALRTKKHKTLREFSHSQTRMQAVLPVPSTTTVTFANHDDDEDDDDATEDSSSDHDITNTYNRQDDSWDKNLFDVNSEPETRNRSIADCQPSHITHNPW